MCCPAAIVPQRVGLDTCCSEGLQWLAEEGKMEKIEINTPDANKLLPLLLDAIERQKRILSQSLQRTEEKIQQLSHDLQVDPNALLAGQVPHKEEQDMDLLELEGELEIMRHLREQLDRLEHLTIWH
jgi:hypothetical protein